MQESSEKGHFEIAGELSFRASHYLRTFRGSTEDLHEHDYRVRIAIKADELDTDGIAFDFGELDVILQLVRGKYEGHSLNELSDFAAINPSTENLARSIADFVYPKLKSAGVRVAFVEVFELEHMSACYYPG